MYCSEKAMKNTLMKYALHSGPKDCSGPSRSDEGIDNLGYVLPVQGSLVDRQRNNIVGNLVLTTFSVG